jgi:hypothetical protein
MKTNRGHELAKEQKDRRMKVQRTAMLNRHERLQKEHVKFNGPAIMRSQITIEDDRNWLQKIFGSFTI